MKEFLRKALHNQKLRMCGLAFFDILSILLSLTCCLFVRFFVENGTELWNYYGWVAPTLLLTVPITLATFAVFGLYTRIWVYAGLRESLIIVLADFAATLEAALISVVLNAMLPASCFVMYFLFMLMFTFAARFSFRFARLISHRISNSHNVDTRRRVMIIGAGDAGNMLIREYLESTQVNVKVVCVIDDDVKKLNRYILGVPIVGGIEALPEAAKKYKADEIVFAIPSAPPKIRRKYVEVCQETSCSLKTLPGIYQLVKNEAILSSIRKVSVADLLGREQIKLDMTAIRGYLKGKTVLVTGGGGSIGSELCRQIASYEPKRLVIFDIYENSAYYIKFELEKIYPDLELYVLIGSVRDNDRLDYVFRTYRPDIVYHAAAHKHVPLMETSPNEAVKNNVFGTLNLVQTADRYGVRRFVMISTDKAVNPTNIMGATKRICEEIIQVYGRRSKTEFVAVRFGNVLGSNGSVIPIFRQQIEDGGPVTVTHPDIIRYFMTIPEAASLVLEAGTYAKGGEIYVLDMGDPVKILTLAENMIKLSGFIPYKDIAIEFTGLRPGEKLYEELLMDEEGMQDTENKLIHIGHPLDIDESLLIDTLKKLRLVMADENADVRSLIKKLVPTFKYEPEMEKQKMAL